MEPGTRALATTVKAFGVLAGLAGIEHGLGDALQGSVRPEGLMIQSWPDAPFFTALHGEPAMTVIPNLLITGLLAIVASLLFLLWVFRYVEGRRGALGLVLLSIALLLVGGGFGPPLLGLILGAAATGIGAPLGVWRRLLPRLGGERLASWWPWVLGAALVAWVMLSVGIGLLAQVAGVDSIPLTMGIIVAAFALLLLSIVSAIARDAGAEPAAAAA